MRLKYLDAKNFLGLEHASVRFGDITVLYGANGSGKSSVADAIYFALTGEAVRGCALPDLVRQGSKEAAVELQLDGLNIIRSRTRSAGEVCLDGAVEKANMVAGLIQGKLGVPARTVAAALRAGALLELKPAELLKLLGELTGARFDASTIADALGGEVAGAAARAGIPLPATLDEFPKACAAAEGARKAAKRTLAEREADLERVPQVGDITVIGAFTSAEQIAEALKAARARELADVAAAAKSAGAIEERARAIRERLAELDQAKHPAGDDPRHDLGKAKAAVAELHKQLGGTEATIGQARKVIADMTGRLVGEQTRDPEDQRTRQELIAHHEQTMRTRDEARDRVNSLTEQGVTLARRLKEAQAHPCDGGCREHCPDTKGIEASLAKMRDDLRAEKKKAADAAQVLVAIDAALDAADQEQLRADIAAQEANLAKLEARLKELRERVGSANDRVSQLEAAAAAFEAWDRTTVERARLDGELVRLELDSKAAPKATGPSVEQLERASVAWNAVAARNAAQVAVDQARKSVEDADVVAQATGPKGARAKLIARAAEPFLAAANSALARLWAGAAVALVADEDLELVLTVGGHTFRPAQLSDGQRTRLLFVLQYAVTRLARVGLLVLDRVELVDDAGRLALKRLVAACSAEGIQVVMLTCAPAPASVAASLAAYAMKDGRAEPLAAATSPARAEARA